MRLRYDERCCCTKINSVTLEEPIGEGVAEQFQKGVQLNGEKDLTKPASLPLGTPKSCAIVGKLGKYISIANGISYYTNRS